MRVFVFCPAYSTAYPSVDEFKLYIDQFGAKLIGYNVTDMIYFMVDFERENETYSSWSAMKDDDTPIKIGEEGKWWMYS
jgi:hypothetical protein